MKTAIIRFAKHTSTPNVFGKVDYVENVESIDDAIKVIWKYYSIDDIKLIQSITIKKDYKSKI